MAGTEKNFLSSLLPIAFGPQDQSAVNKLPESGSSDAQNSLETATDPYVVEVIVAENIRGGERLSGDYLGTANLAKKAKEAGLDPITLIRGALENLGYELKQLQLRNVSFQNVDLQGGLSISRERVIAAQEMTEQELLNAVHLIEGNKESEEKGVVKLSEVLKEKEWKVIYSQNIPGQGLKAIVVMSETEEKIAQLAETSVNVAPETYKEEPTAVGGGGSNSGGSQFLNTTNVVWDDLRDHKN